MPPPRRHRGGHRGPRHFRGGRGWGPSVVYLENVPDVVYCDGEIVDGMCIVRNEAGQIIPTFVTPDDARRYIDEVDAGYRRLENAIASSSTVNVEFKTSWGIQLAAWTAFAVPAKATVGWLNTTAVMQQTDRFNDQLKNWYAGFKAVGGDAGPPPVGPGQGIPQPPGTGTTAELTKLVTAVGLTAAVILIAPKMLSLFR